MSKLTRLVAAAAIYFLLVMCAGFVLGTIRELLLVPKLGRAIAEPLEAPFMLAAILLAAWATLRWLPLEPQTGVRLAMGGVSLGMVLLAELALSPLVRGSVQAWFDSFTPLTLALSFILWSAHVLAPTIVLRKGIAA
ncbi:hypothetical protein [Alsobacter sp. R-9]